MKVGKVSELIGRSGKSFEDAAQQVIRRAARTLAGVTGIEVMRKRVLVEGDRAAWYEVRLRLSFEVAPESHWHV